MLRAESGKEELVLVFRHTNTLLQIGSSKKYWTILISIICIYNTIFSILFTLCIQRRSPYTKLYEIYAMMVRKNISHIWILFKAVCIRFLSWFNELREEESGAVGICFCAFWLHNSHDGRPLYTFSNFFYFTRL